MGESLETLRGAAEQLRNGGAVPVGVGDLGVAEIGRESEDLAIDVGAVLTPAQQPSRDESVAKVVNAWLARASVPSPAQTLPDPGKRLLYGMALESRRTLGAEEVLRPRCSATPVAAVGVAGECLGRGRMEWNESGLAELGLADDEDAVDEFDVVGREEAGLGEPQAGRDQQGEVCDIGGGPQPVLGQQAACLLQQRSYFRLGVDVRRRSAWDAAQEPGRRDLGRWIKERAVSRELSHGREPRTAWAGLLDREDCAHSTASSTVTAPL